MPRPLKLLKEIIETAQQQLQADHDQLRKLKMQVSNGNGPAPDLLQKQIRAMRDTIANGTEDLNDLAIEMEEAKVYASSEEAQKKIVQQQNKIRVLDALTNVCVATASEADRALLHAQFALQRHRRAHEALHNAVGEAHTALTAGDGHDPMFDQLFLLHSYSNIKNSGVAVAQWILDALAGYEMENHIKVEGLIFDSKRVVRMVDYESSGLDRCRLRIRDYAKRCGVEAPALDDPALPVLTEELLKAMRSVPALSTRT